MGKGKVGGRWVREVKEGNGKMERGKKEGERIRGRMGGRWVKESERRKGKRNMGKVKERGNG